MTNNLFSINNKKISYSKETIDILRLIRSENIGPKTFMSLIKLFGNASLALENIADFSIRGGKEKAIKICSKNDAIKEIELLSKNNAYLITYKDSNYPKLLLQIFDPPPVLSYSGNIELLKNSKTVAIVGARNSSLNAQLFTKKLVQDLIKAGYNTVAGLARGIDTVTHTTSIENTIAVIAGGIGNVYPPENSKLFSDIAKKGLIISELPIYSKPYSYNFPQRNRIISGISLATIIIEASIHSGSLITAQYAIDHNRELFAVPGFPMDPRCMGTNKLIKDGAYLLESANDIITQLDVYNKNNQPLTELDNNDKNFTLNKNLTITSQERQKIINLLSASSITYEMLAIESKLPMPIVLTICIELELAGKITRYPGNKIALIC